MISLIYNQYHDYLIIPGCLLESGLSLKLFPPAMSTYLDICLIEPWRFNRIYTIIKYDNSDSKNNNNKDNDNKQIFHAFLFNIKNYSPEVINI